MHKLSSNIGKRVAHTKQRNIFLYIWDLKKIKQCPYNDFRPHANVMFFVYFPGASQKEKGKN